jgi:hypothetical protein
MDTKDAFSPADRTPQPLTQSSGFSPQSLSSLPSRRRTSPVASPSSPTAVNLTGTGGHISWSPRRPVSLRSADRRYNNTQVSGLNLHPSLPSPTPSSDRTITPASRPRGRSRFLCSQRTDWLNSPRVASVGGSGLCSTLKRQRKRDSADDKKTRGPFPVRGLFLRRRNPLSSAAA